MKIGAWRIWAIVATVLFLVSLCCTVPACLSGVYMGYLWQPKSVPVTLAPTGTPIVANVPPAIQPAAPVATAAVPVPTAQPTATAVPVTLHLTEGVYLDWVKGADLFRQSDGMYLIPVSYLTGLANDAAAILFEGEYAESVGIHSICYVTGDVAIKCNQNGGNMHINQGSFWAYQNNPKGDLPDDLLAVFAHDKWQNWKSQGINGNPIEVFLSTGIIKYAGGIEPTLSPDQVMIVDRNAADRCPADKPQILENPYSDAVNATDPVVIGAPGSYSCRTLFVGKLTPDGNLVSYYWRGAKDGFSYVAAATSFYLIPESWGEKEMEAFVATLNAKFLGQYTTK